MGVEKNMEYMSSLIASVLSMIFVVFLIGTVGYMLGAIEVKGISLGTAGVLLAALLYGVFASYVPGFTIGGRDIVLFGATVKEKFSLLSSVGTAMFVTSVGLIAGPKFFRSFSKTTMSYVWMGMLTIGVGALVTVAFACADEEMSPALAVGLMAGALTSTPGLSAAKEAAGTASDLVTAGYGIAYLFGVLGVVFFVQITPRILRIDVAREREGFVAASIIKTEPKEETARKVEPMGFFPFFMAITLGCVIGAVKLPGLNFSLGNSGGCLVAGLIIGHFGHLGKMDLSVDKSILNFFRELGLVLFLIGAGVPGGVNFVANIKIKYFLYGALITLTPMIGSYFIGRYVFKLNIFNNLGSITGGMTSTPALGALIATAGTDEVTAAYAVTYPVALVFVVVAAKVIILLM